MAFFLAGATTFSQEVSIDSLLTDSETVNTDYTPIANEAPPRFDSLLPDEVPSYQPYVINDSILQRLKSDEAFWYANEAPKKAKNPKQADPLKIKKPFYLQPWFRIGVWIIMIGGFVAVLIWFLIASDVRLFRKKASVLHSGEGDELSEDIFAIDYEAELQSVAASKNYRLGVRLMFLHLLKQLSDRQIINYKIEKTNSDYLLQLYNTAYYKDFFRMTRNFEYVWYGKFDLPLQAFESIQRDYMQFKNRLS